MSETKLGATPDSSGRTTFLLWAPRAASVDVQLAHPEERVVPMESLPDGYWSAVVEGCLPGARYFYRLDGRVQRADPASRFQPISVHGPSEIVAPAAPSYWRGIVLDEYIIYEIHVGTFTLEGTFDAVIAHLPRLKQLGITAIELMPVAEFPGGRNWGYDGTYPFAAEKHYGGVPGLRRLIEACHAMGLAVILDVVYNHLGPEGNYLRDFGPYFNAAYRTPWGDALNFDGPDSDEVRRYFVENALYWLAECGVDALRLDAVHAIHDHSAYPFLQELADGVREYAVRSGRNVFLIAESDLNDSRLVRSASEGGIGLDSQWADDFHHCLHTLLTGESTGYYADYGAVEQFAAAMQDGWVYHGQHSRARRARVGSSPAFLEGRCFVVFAQNHDQIGNRMKGDRLVHQAGYQAARLAAAAVLLSPYIPLLFMGEEYGESAPFLYFISHSDPELQDAVRLGRKEEFVAFRDQGEPPDPQAEATFLTSKLNQNLLKEGSHAELYAWYSALLALRKSHPSLRLLSKRATAVEVIGKTVVVRRSSESEHVVMILHFGGPAEVRLELPQGGWDIALSSGVVRSDVGRGFFELEKFGCVVLSGR